MRGLLISISSRQSISASMAAWDLSQQVQNSAGNIVAGSSWSDAVFKTESISKTSRDLATGGIYKLKYIGDVHLGCYGRGY